MSPSSLLKSYSRRYFDVFEEKTLGSVVGYPLKQLFFSHVKISFFEDLTLRYLVGIS